MMKLKNSKIFNFKEQLANRKLFNFRKIKYSFIHPRKYFSVSESTFVKSVDKEKDNTDNLSLMFLRNESFETFLEFLIEDPHTFFKELASNNLQLLKLDNGDKNITLVLNSIENILKYVLLYEGSQQIFNEYKIYLNLVLNEMFNSSKFKNKIEDFINLNLSKLDYKQNIYVLYFVYSVSNFNYWKIETTFKDFLLMKEGDIIKNTYDSAHNKENSKNNTNNSLYQSILRFLNVNFSDVVKLMKKESFNFKSAYSMISHSITETIVIISEILINAMSFCLANNLGQHNYLNFFVSADEALGDYIISKNNCKEINKYLLFSITRIRVRNHSIYVMPFSFTNLCREFVFNKNQLDRVHLLLILRFIKESYKDSFVSVSFCMVIKSVLFYVDDYLSDYKTTHEISTSDLVEIVSNLSFVNFELNNNLLLEIPRRNKEILDLNLETLYRSSTSFCLVSNNMHDFFLHLFKDNRFYSLDRIKFLNVGISAALSRFDDLNCWKLWFQHIKNRKWNNLNNIDIKMIVEIKYILESIDSHKYKEIEYLIDEILKYNSSYHKQMNTTAKRWFHSKKIEKESLIELQLKTIFKNKNIKFKAQYFNEDLNIDADFLIGENVVLEICGPSHFMITPDIKFNKKTQLKKEIWEYHGYYAIYINYIQLVSTNLEYVGEYITECFRSTLPEKEFSNIFHN